MLHIYQVKDYLKNCLAPEVADEAQFNEWLDSLFIDDLGQVLGINLYIDLMNDALDHLLVAQVIDRMIASSSDARERFCVCLEDEAYQLDYICKNRQGPQPLLKDRYITILPLESMIEYYFRYALTLPSSSSFEAQDEILRNFFKPKKEDRKGLGIINRTWRGRMQNVWVTSKNQIDALRFATAEDKFANAVRDRLGFAELDEGTLVGIIYPANFDGLKAYIPTTLDAHAGCHFFIPFASVKSTWGFTCGLNSRSPGLSERVHQSFEGLTDEFESEMIGEITEEAMPDWVYLLEQARKRAWGILIL
jgi:hypothetical protein